jgi:hypothetical protein
MNAASDSVSIAPVQAGADRIFADSIGVEVMPDSTIAEPVQVEIAPPPVSTRDELKRVEEQLATARAQQQLAALRVAEFYEFSLQEPDSARPYYEFAASKPFTKKCFEGESVSGAGRHGQ